MNSVRRATVLLALVIAVSGGSRRTTPEPAAAARSSDDVKPRASQPEQEASCRPEELSCGLQKPTLSDGVTRFVNEDMGVSAVFPRGSQVCIGRSGDAHRGFYAWYGMDVQGCPERGDMPVTFMSVTTMFNALDYSTPRQAAHDGCRPLSPAVIDRLGGHRLEFAGHPSSLACQEGDADAAFSITIYALAGRSPYDKRDTALVIYIATLGTDPKRLDEDLQRFRAFLRSVRIGQFD
jgi:hypothetical protein